MKWPNTLTLVRHDISTFNAGKRFKEADQLYVEFRQEFEANPESAKTLALARAVYDKYRPEVGDWNTPLWDGESIAAERVAHKLPGFIDLPHVIFRSPYLRTQATLDGLIRGWLALGDVRTYVDDRLREQEHGLANLYGDWRVFHTLHPDQRKLYALQERYFYCFPQGESVPDVRQRVLLWLSTLTRDFADKDVLVVTHHLTILAIRATLERLSPQEFIRLDEEEKPLNCGVTIYRGHPKLGTDGRLKLLHYNLKLF